jgi:hypothetical protein
MGGIWGHAKPTLHSLVISCHSQIRGQDTKTSLFTKGNICIKGVNVRATLLFSIENEKIKGNDTYISLSVICVKALMYTSLLSILFKWRFIFANVCWQVSICAGNKQPGPVELWLVLISMITQTISSILMYQRRLLLDLRVYGVVKTTCALIAH